MTTWSRALIEIVLARSSRSAVRRLRSVAAAAWPRRHVEVLAHEQQRRAQQGPRIRPDGGVRGWLAQRGGADVCGAGLLPFVQLKAGKSAQRLRAIPRLARRRHGLVEQSPRLQRVSGREAAGGRRPPVRRCRSSARQRGQPAARSISSAAVAVEPRARAWAAAARAGVATNSSGPVAASAKWRARCSESSTSTARRACSARRAAGPRYS